MNVTTLYERIKQDVIQWRENNYKSDFEEIEEILNFQFLDDAFNSTFYFLIGLGGMYGTVFGEGVIIDISMLKTNNINYSTHFFHT